MSKYTTEVRYICEKAAGLDESGDYDDISTILHACHSSVIGTYPIFDETYRETLNTKILKHYYTREICEETVGLWKLRLNARMNEIMPYYNKLYESELLEFNPFYDIDLNTSHLKSEDKDESSSGTRNDTKTDNRITSSTGERVGEETTDSQSTSTNTNTAEATQQNNSSGNTSNQTNNKSFGTASGSENKVSTDKYSDTPQGAINGLESDTYLTNARLIDNTDTNTQTNQQSAEALGTSEFSEMATTKDNSSSAETEEAANHGKTATNDKTTTSEAEQKNSQTHGDHNETKNINTTEDYLEHVYGKRSGISYAKMLMEFRDTFLNIDRMVINDLSDLFFGLWD